VITIVQLGRYGDILNLLPLVKFLVEEQDWEVRWIVCDAFRDILEGILYIKEKISIPEYDLAAGISVAFNWSDPVYVTQVYQNPARKEMERKYKNFQWAQWSVLEYDFTYDLPLDLPCVKWTGGHGEILHHKVGVSAPAYRGFLPGKSIECKGNFYTLASQLTSCSLFIGIDSGPLFLADAVGVPTVGLIPQTGWTAREPNPRWIACGYY
jgi:ADP-heptose:LPS heptosyltransferase